MGLAVTSLQPALADLQFARRGGIDRALSRRYLELLESQLPSPEVGFVDLLLALADRAPALVRQDLAELGVLGEGQTTFNRQQVISTLRRIVDQPDAIPELALRYSARLVPTLTFIDADPSRARALLGGRYQPAQALQVVETAHILSAQHGFETLLALDSANIEPYQFQIDGVLRVLREMKGMAILADEVGLGKTIEAGLILSELMMRGLISNCLILVPATLVDQWKDEMYDKFALEFEQLDRDTDVAKSTLLVASIDRAKGQSAERLRGRVWDMLIVDECHILKNHQSRNFKFVFSLQKKFCLLLSATPVQNDLRELYNLITIARPGHLKSRRQFQRFFMEDRRVAKNVPRLRQLLSQVMIRRQRSDTLIKLPRRLVEQIDLDPSPAELEFHRAVLEFARSIYDKYVEGSVRVGFDGQEVEKILLVLLVLLKEVCSSPRAALQTLNTSMRLHIQTLATVTDVRDDLAALDAVAHFGDSVAEPTKLRALLDLLETNKREKIVVYTEFRKTQEVIDEALRPRGWRTVVFNGTLSGPQKRAALARFKGDGQAFISTESGGQGLNLQFAHTMVNYDLPWNPMRIEQRIGRLHRFGQEKEVTVYNLSLRGTIEEYILHILTSKIDMFQTVVGRIESVLGSLENQTSLEVRIREIILESPNFEAMHAQLLRLGDELRKAREDYEEAERDAAEVLDAIA